MPRLASVISATHLIFLSLTDQIKQQTLLGLCAVGCGLAGVAEESKFVEVKLRYYVEKSI